ncbi:site-2 protease family protein [Hominenteromicrobium sp.]
MTLLRGGSVDPISVLMQILATLVIIFLVLPFHEFAHGWAANKLGDPTAKLAGRLTFNPLASIDPLGAVFLLLFGFGWAKPVPVNPYYFKNRKNGMALTALAGPVSNLLMAAAALMLYKLLYYFAPYTSFVQILISVLVLIAQINISLCAFNLIPLPPLDGSKVIGFFLPMNLYARFENFFARYQQIILYAMIVLLFVLPRLGCPLSVLSNIIDVPFNWLWNAMFWAANKLTFFVDLIAGAVL